MPRNHELNHLKAIEQDAFQRKQSAFQRYIASKDRASEAHDEMERAWQERSSAREEMNHEFERNQQAWEHYRSVWDEYGRVKEANSRQIDRLRADADYEHQAMQDAFNQASSEYEYGDKSLAPYYSQQGHEHKARRDDLNAEVSQLCQEIKDAKARAEWSASKPDDSAFRNAKERFESAKARHEHKQAEFKRLKAERDQAKAEFNSLQEEWKRCKDAFQTKLEQVKAENKRERERALDKAGVRWSEREDAKIVKKADGTVQVYHGGLGQGDGLSHGHTVLDQFGNKVYEREAFAEHGPQNYTDDPTKFYPGKGQWGELRHGWIKDHAVTWCEGTGVNSGQTLICDGHVTREYFDSRHDHYGPDSKYKSGDRIEDITDSMGRKKHYSGPGK
jgi:cell division protein FtsB